MNRVVEIGHALERVEIIDEPVSGPRGRIGRMRHANGENVAIEHATLERLIARAEGARENRTPDRERDACGDSGVLFA